MLPFLFAFSSSSALSLLIHPSKTKKPVSVFISEEMRQDQNQAHGPFLARHALPPTTAPLPFCLLPENVIEVGGFYQVDQSKLLPWITPTQLKGALVVMVSEIDPHTVCVAFPSIHSLHTHITEQGYQFGNLIPALDARYVMTPQVASEVFCRRIPTKEIADRSNIWNFWAFKPSAGEKGTEVIVLDDDDIEQENEEDLNLRRSRKKRKLEDPVARARWLAKRYKLENEKVEKLSIEVTKLKRDAAAALTTILEDPCCTPPPPGDNPTHQDPACARELMELKEELDKLRRYWEIVRKA